MQNTYTQHGKKFFAFLEPIRSEREVGQETHVTDAHNWYIFDADGWCWDCKRQIDLKLVLNEYGNGFFKERVVYTIDEPVDAFRKPIVETDEWIQGSFDKGYALETIRESLGLNIQYLTQLMETDETSE